MDVKIKVLHEDATIPYYASTGAAGFDICTIEDVMLMSNGSVIVRTGLAFQIPEGYELEIRSRSGLGFKHSVWAFNGTIDSDYRGEVKVLLQNMSDQVRYFSAGERICQGVIKKIERVQFEAVESLEDTERGSGGFGHTGK